MNRKSLLFSLLVLILGISLLAGCGGGGSKKKPRLSTDFYGLEVGAQKSYTAKFTPGDLSSAATYEVLSKYSTDTFRVSWTDSGDSDGEFIKKDADGSYYEVGYWENDNESEWVWYEEEGTPFELIVKNPVTVGSESDWWGKALREENVTVPAGTFKAWVFRDHDQWDDDDGTNYFETSYYWFVPYLGFVKSTSKTTKEGDSEVTESITAVLQSYSF